MNQVFLTFTFASDFGNSTLVQTENGVKILAVDGIPFEQIQSLIDALGFIQDSVAKRAATAAPENEGEGTLSLGRILPPFNFDSDDKLSALVGRKVRLRRGDVVSVLKVDLDCSEDQEKIQHSKGWVYRDGTFYRGYAAGCDIVEVCPVNE